MFLYQLTGFGKEGSFLAENQVCRTLGLVHPGLVRYYVNTDGEDKTCNAHPVDNKNQNKHFVLRSLNKLTEMKKPHKIPKPRTEPSVENGIPADAIFDGLNITERTQKPPSEELILKLNLLASKPPFSYRHKVNENIRL
jgi:hypothetical protein